MKPGRTIALAAALLVMPAAWGCADRDEAEVDATPATEMASDSLRVVEVDLGRSIGADKRLAADAETDDFRPADTIYAVVATEGTGSGATLTARWTYQDGQVVDETSQTLSPAGRAYTEFHISRPGGFPTGDYQVEILLNRRSIEKKEFEVK